MTQIQSHPVDAELLEYVDGELSSSRLQIVAEHVEHCDQCQLTVESFSANSDHVEEFLRAVNLPKQMPMRGQSVRAPRLAIISPIDTTPRWYARTSLRAALAVFALGAATLTVSPVRAWVADFIRGATQSDNSSPPVQGNETNPVVDRNTASVSYVPMGAVFELTVAELQQDGSLTIEMGAGGQIRGSIMGAPSGDVLLVTGTGLRIQNTAQSRSSFRIQVPQSIREIVLRVSDLQAKQLSTTDIGRSGEITVSLANGTIQ